MADSDKELKIKITTAADTSGLDKTNAALRESKASAREQALAQGTVTDATRNYIKSLEGAAAGEGKFNLSKRDTVMLTRSLAKGLPELGHIIADLSNPYFALALTIGAAVGKMVELHQQMQAMKERPGPDWSVQTDQLEELQKVYDETANSLAAFEREMDRAARKQDGPEEVAARRIENLKRALTAEEEYNNARKKLEEDSIAEQEERGLITHEQALQRKFQLDQEYEQKRLAAEEKQRQAEIFAKQREASEALFKQHAAAENIGPASAAVAVAEAAAKKNDQTLERNKADLAAALAERKTLQDELAELHDLGAYGPLSPEQKGTMAIKEGQNATNEAHIADLIARIAGGNAAAPGLKDSADARKEELEALKTIFKEQTETIRKLNAELPEMVRRAAEDSATHRATAGVGTLDAAGKVPIGGGFTGASEQLYAQLVRQQTLFNNHVQGATQLTASQEQFAASFEQYAGITDRFHNQFTPWLVTLAGTLTTLSDKLAAQEKIMQQIMRQHGQFPQQPPTNTTNF